MDTKKKKNPTSPSKKVNVLEIQRKHYCSETETENTTSNDV